MAPQKQNPADRNKLGTFRLVGLGIGSTLIRLSYRIFVYRKKQIITPIRIV